MLERDSCDGWSADIRRKVNGSLLSLHPSQHAVPLVTCTLTAAIVCLDSVLICYCLLSTLSASLIHYSILRFYVV